jgi:hypothetical protein
MKKLIVNNRDAFYESREQVLGYNPNQAWRIIVGAVVVLGIVFRMANRCDSRSDYQDVSPEYQELLNNLREMKVDKDGKTYYVPVRTSGYQNFNESAFLDLHERVVTAVQDNDFSPYNYIRVGDPGITSPFKPFPDDGEKRVIWNETPSDMVMIISGKNSLASHFIPSGDSTSFNIEENACMFFYGGTNWSNDQTIQHLHRSIRPGKLELIQFNGYFSTQFNRDLQFLRKFFTVVDDSPEDFRIKTEKGEYELHQGDGFVNYSY